MHVQRTVYVMMSVEPQRGSVRASFPVGCLDPQASDDGLDGTGMGLLWVRVDAAHSREPTNVMLQRGLVKKFRTILVLEG